MIQFRPYQPPAIEWLSKRRFGLVKAPAGSGKTIIAAGALCRVVMSKKRTVPVKIGWVCNTIEQRDQAWKALKLFPEMAMVTEIQVECAQGMPDMSDRDVLVVDECHHATSPLWLSVIEPCKGALWFFSATPWVNEDRDAKLRELCRNEVFEIDRADIGENLADGHVVMLTASDMKTEWIQEGIDKNLDNMVNRFFRFKMQEIWAEHHPVVAKELEIPILPGETPAALFERLKGRGYYSAICDKLKRKMRQDFWPRVAFQVCMDRGIVQDERRNHAIICTARQHAKDSVLILIHSVAHGEKLVESIPGSMLVHSKLAKKKREKAIQDFRDGHLRCLIATSLADEGLDCPRANVLILACAGKASGKIEQRTGRVLRSFKGKSHGVIYDFNDEQHSLLRSQSRKRVQVYRALGYRIEGELL